MVTEAQVFEWVDFSIRYIVEYFEFHGNSEVKIPKPTIRFNVEKNESAIKYEVGYKDKTLYLFTDGMIDITFCCYFAEYLEAILDDTFPNWMDRRNKNIYWYMKELLCHAMYCNKNEQRNKI